MPVGSRQLLRFGPFEFDPCCGQLRRKGVGVKLQGQPIQILEILLERPGDLVTREEIRQHLWTSHTFVDFDHSLNTAIKKLRQALGDEADAPCYIETLPKRGYRFIGEIDREEPRKTSTVDPAEAEGNAVRIVTSLAEAAINASTEAKRRLRRIAFLISATAFLVVAVGAAAYWVTKPPPMPRIVATHTLTRTGYHKSPGGTNRLVTDGTAVYFREDRVSSVATMQIPSSGGEASQISVDAGVAPLRDISKNGSQLLISCIDPESGGWDVCERRLPGGPQRLILKDARWPVWTADGRGIFFARNGDRELWRVNADGTDPRLLTNLPDITGLAVSPDGRLIRFGVGSTNRMWEVGSDGSNSHPIFPEHKESVGIGDWSPDGRYFFFLSRDGDRDNLWAASEKRNWYKRSPKSPQRLTFGPLWIGTPTVSRDGKQVFAVGREPHVELVVYDPKTGRFVPYLGGMSALYLDFSSDGQWVAYVSYPEGTLWRSRADGSERMQLTVPPLKVRLPRWSPDGKLIAFMELSEGAGKNRIYAISPEGGGPMLLLAGEEGVGDPTWSADGTAIAYGVGLGEVRVLDLRTQKSSKVPGSDGYWSPRWSPDGKYLVALAGLPSKLVLYSFGTQRWEKLSSVDSQNFGWPKWSRDSKFVYALRVDAPVRITIANHKQEQIPSVAAFPGFGWWGFTPDGRPLTSQDTGIEEIYAFDLEYK